MNDTELVALALSRRDEHVKACPASRTDRGRTTTIAAFIFLLTVAGIFWF